MHSAQVHLVSSAATCQLSCQLSCLLVNSAVSSAATCQLSCRQHPLGCSVVCGTLLRINQEGIAAVHEAQGWVSRCF